jgi:hypothetical protein
MEPATSEAATMESAAAEASSRSGRIWSQRQHRCDDRNTTWNRQLLLRIAYLPLISGIGSCVSRDDGDLGLSIRGASAIGQADAQDAVTGTVRPRCLLVGFSASVDQDRRSEVGGNALRTLCSSGWWNLDRRLL